MSNRLAQEIETILGEALGDFIARATVKKNCELIGTTPDSLTPEQLPELLEKIGKSVSFFSGKNAEPELLERIKSLGVRG